MFFIHFSVWFIGIVVKSNFNYMVIEEERRGCSFIMKIIFYPILPLLTVYLTSREVIIMSLISLMDPVWDLENSHFAVFMLVYLFLGIGYLTYKINKDASDDYANKVITRFLKKQSWWSK
jgi:amino acid permease